METKFKVGDKVKVNKELTKYEGDPGVNDDMLKMKEETFTIRKVITDHGRGCYAFYRLAEGEYVWGEPWLTKADGSVEVIEIREDLVRLLRKKNGKKTIREKTVKLTDLIERIIKSGNQEIIKTPILPPDIRYYEQRGEKEVVVMELQPEVRSVVWSNDNQRDMENKRAVSNKEVRESMTYSLAFPYVIIIMGFRKGVVQAEGWGSGLPLCFFSNSPVNSLEDILYNTHLQNVSTSTHWLCLHPGSETKNIFDGCAVIINELWNGVFTHNMQNSDDYQVGIEQEIDSRVRFIKDWQENTQKDPLFILDIPWRRSRHTIESAIQSAFGQMNSSVTKNRPITDANGIIDIMYRLREVREDVQHLPEG